ncbi:MAG: YggS family pyridoxal phosphate-dependent enzyme [Planctomycetia bacterium]|nr:MAG: YggS family pyridoxal phosphate-dependent enzyme [Planctomycetia bacterium]
MTTPPFDQLLPRLRANVSEVRGRVSAAARRSGRDPSAVRLVAVAKGLHADLLPLLLADGVCNLGESRVQQLVRRAEQLARPPCSATPAETPVAPGRSAAPPAANRPIWHMIGHLQRNKVAALLPHCTFIHAVDSERLAREIDQRANATGIDAVNVLIEVNVSGEAAKHGIRPAELDGLLTTTAGLPRLRLRGLMTMAPFSDDPESARPHFANLRRLRDDVVQRGVMPASFCELSMGMSGDYEVAVSEGATLVRVGSALGQGLPPAE